MTSPQQEADELFREWQERRRRNIAPERRSGAKLKISDGAATIQPAEPGFSFFALLVSLRAELRAGKDTVTCAKRLLASVPKSLPRYVERTRNGNLSFQVYPGGRRTPLPNDPTAPEFRAAYNAALVEAISLENDDD